MTPKEQSAMQQALDALEVHQPDPEQKMVTEAIIALRKALAEQAEQEPMKECRHCGFLCKPNSNESRKWYPLEQAEQEPVCCDKCGSKLGTTVVPCDCAAPVRTKDLTEYELDELRFQNLNYLDYARAVIAADRELNK